METVGDFIFINFSETPPRTLVSPLGDEICDQLISLSQRINEKIFHHEIKHGCNWKFFIANVIEIKHCHSIHKETLVKARFCKAPPEQHTGLVKNSYFIIPVSTEAEKKRSLIINYLFGKNNINQHYKHTYIYPNLLISDFEGINFNIGKINPVSASESLFRMDFYVASPANDNEEIFNEYKNSTIEFGIKVFEEDRSVLEKLQLGVQEISHNGNQYISEERIECFFKFYFNSLNTYGKD